MLYIYIYIVFYLAYCHILEVYLNMILVSIFGPIDITQKNINPNLSNGGLCTAVFNSGSTKQGRHPLGAAISYVNTCTSGLDKFKASGMFQHETPWHQ